MPLVLVEQANQVSLTIIIMITIMSCPSSSVLLKAKEEWK
jgi:hypothetical protein